jgi:hypothetical protein
VEKSLCSPPRSSNTILNKHSPKNFRHVYLGVSVSCFGNYPPSRKPSGAVSVSVLWPKDELLIIEVAELLGLNYRILDFSVPYKTFEIHEVILVPRWDVLCLRPHLTCLKDDTDPRFQRLRDVAMLNRPDLWRHLRSPTVSDELKKEFASFRTWLIDLFGKQTGGHIPVKAGDVLVLRRSQELPFYEKDGAAETKGYGTGRRSLVNVKETVLRLYQKGINSVEFECGAHSLADQALAFNACDGVAMIRGAEIANLIWTRPGTPVFIVVPENMVNRPPPHDGISELMGIHVQQEIVDSINPELNTVSVAVFFRQNMHAAPKDRLEMK